MYYETEYSDGKDQGLKYNPFKGLVVPRPIGWVSTLSEDGIPNLAPFSFFNGVSATPPMVAVCSNGRHTEDGIKDTMQNIAAMSEFVVNIATWDLREPMNLSAAALARGVDEFEFAGVTATPSRLIKSPRVAESPINLECVLIDIVELPAFEGTYNHVAFCKVVGVHIRDDIIRDGRVDIGLLRPISRLGYYDYAVISEVFEMRAPRV